MSPLRTVVVTAPSRLHFGLLSFGDPSTRQYGGAGMMVQQPPLQVQLQVAEEFVAAGPLAERIHEIVPRWANAYADRRRPRCQIEILAAPPPHAGFGTGTQLALAVGAGLHALHGIAAVPIEELAATVGRGLRSAVGTYGFRLGGLIAELGKHENEVIAPLYEWLAMPEPWRIVLITPRGSQRGLSGLSERDAFANLPPVEPDITRRLTDLLCDDLLPATRDEDFARFSEALFAYGRLAGSCFAAVQGGSYRGARLARLVEQIRRLGIRGVGQSSWGPTLFAVCCDQTAAEHLRNELVGSSWAQASEVTITAANNTGASICVSEITEHSPP